MHRNEIKDEHAGVPTENITVALLGNPNCGKSSLFNQLTGLRQKVGNFPGITVDKKTGELDTGHLHITLIDFPGTYSLYPTAADERIVVQSLIDPKAEDHPDAALYVADVTKLEKHLLLFSQVKDLGLPLVLVLNMADVAEKEGFLIQAGKLSEAFGVPVVTVSSRTGAGLDDLLKAIRDLVGRKAGQNGKWQYTPSAADKKLLSAIRGILTLDNDYQALLAAHHYHWLPFLNDRERQSIGGLVRSAGFQSLPRQVEETMARFEAFTPVVRQAVRQGASRQSRLTFALDTLLTHRLLGPAIFFVLMLLIFQAIYAWAQHPMDWIDAAFSWTGAQVKILLPDAWYTNLLTDGLLAGLGGILVFIPQIAILFFLITLLEEVGYMARAAFLFDRLMQAFGLNGRSIVALISGGACAIPAIMSTRSISNWKERLITILVTPLISCSARIPVYTVLIGFAVPPLTVGGIFNLPGLAFMGLYLLGIAAALAAALAFKLILKSGEHSFLMLEMPDYRLPVMRNVWLTVWEKVKTFALEAGKVIMAISVVLWVLASYGPPGEMARARTEALATAQTRQLDETETEDLLASRLMEASYAGHLGRAIEPAIQPLGFDWKIGIALITSFAAREVFVGTMATIYSIGSEDDEYSVRSRMAEEVDPATGEPLYNQARSWSLLIFYVFAMMCMSTLAVVKRETKSWKWPLVQFLFMTGLAYLSSLLVYQWLS